LKEKVTNRTEEQVLEYRCGRDRKQEKENAETRVQFGCSVLIHGRGSVDHMNVLRVAIDKIVHDLGVSRTRGYPNE
jgi:hypothetical protein